MISNVKVSIMYEGNDNQWKIELIHNGEERTMSNIREIELISMYHCLAKELVEKHNYNFTYSDSEISRCFNVETYGGRGSFPRNRKWVLRGAWGRYELLHNYDYESVKDCYTTYGAFDIEEIAELVKGIGEFVLNNDVHKLTYDNLKKQWLSYRDWDIIFTPYDAYRHFFDADEDFSKEAFAKAHKESCRRRWEKSAEFAITLWNTPHEEVRVQVTSKFVNFYRRDDTFTIYKYPPLHELKEDREFFLAMEDLWREAYSEEECEKFVKDFMAWKEDTYAYPPFPIEQIFASEYQNYKCDEID